MNILFTCTGRRVALLRTFRRAMGELGLAGKIIAADASASSPAAHQADVGLVVPRVDSGDYLPRLREIVREHRARLLVPLTDLDLTLLAENRDELQQEGCTVMVAGPAAMAICRDKSRTCHWLAEQGIATVRSLSLGEFRRQPFYPCFAKPRGGSASIGAARIDSREQLEAHASRYGEDLVMQDWAPGQEITIDVYKSRAGEIHAVVPRLRLAVRSGEVEKGVTLNDAGLIESAARIARNLGGFWGVCCCQCRREIDPAGGGEAKFFEINARFGGGAPLSIAAGADLPRYLLEDVLGRTVTGRVGDFTPNLLMMRYDDAAFRTVDDPSSLDGWESPSFR